MILERWSPGPGPETGPELDPEDKDGDGVPDDDEWVRAKQVGEDGYGIKPDGSIINHPNPNEGGLPNDVRWVPISSTGYNPNLDRPVLPNRPPPVIPSEEARRTPHPDTGGAPAGDGYAQGPNKEIDNDLAPEDVAPGWIWIYPPGLDGRPNPNQEQYVPALDIPVTDGEDTCPEGYIRNDAGHCVPIAVDPTTGPEEDPDSSGRQSRRRL